MEIRKCRICGEVKPITEYYQHNGWHDTKCKECAKAYSRKYQKEHAEEYKAYRKRYYQEHKEGNLKHSKEWTEKNRDKHNEYCRKWTRRNIDKVNEYQKRTRGEHPEKYRAQAIINTRIARGKLQKPNVCQVCGKEGRVEAHHADYSKPLDVIWCCKKCHYHLDEERRQKERA